MGTKQLIRQRINMVLIQINIYKFNKELSKRLFDVTGAETASLDRELD